MSQACRIYPTEVNPPREVGIIGCFGFLFGLMIVALGLMLSWSQQPGLGYLFLAVGALFVFLGAASLRRIKSGFDPLWTPHEYEAWSDDGLRRAAVFPDGQTEDGTYFVQVVSRADKDDEPWRPMGELHRHRTFSDAVAAAKKLIEGRAVPKGFPQRDGDAAPKAEKP